MALDPQTRYVDIDGYSLAYQVLGGGQGAHAVWYQELTQHLDLWWTDPSVDAGVGELSRDVTSVLLQRRGVGLSAPVDHVPTVETQATDLLAVMDAVGVGRATLCGVFSTAPAVCLVAARTERAARGSGGASATRQAEHARSACDRAATVGATAQRGYTTRGGNLIGRLSAVSATRDLPQVVREGERRVKTLDRPAEQLLQHVWGSRVVDRSSSVADQTTSDGDALRQYRSVGAKRLYDAPDLGLDAKDSLALDRNAQARSVRVGADEEE